MDLKTLSFPIAMKRLNDLKLHWRKTTTIRKVCSTYRGKYATPVHGMPKCIKSGIRYVFEALVDLFMKIGYIRPNAGYTFNFDNCVDK